MKAGIFQAERAAMIIRKIRVEKIAGIILPGQRPPVNNPGKLSETKDFRIKGR